MTKTLTEQWREGTLEDGAYYILVDKYEQNKPEIDVGVCYNSNFEWWIVKEVLAPVPSYDEYKELTQRVGRLELDNEVLEDVVQECNKRGLENKKLQEQLKEANEILMMPDNIKYNDEVVEMLNNYMEKWGVK